MNIEPKPPDKNIFRVIKCPLKSVLKDYDNIQPKIESLVKEINQVATIGYQFIRLYLLHKYNSDKQLPKINKQFILDVLKTISSTNTKRGKSTKEENIKNKNGKDDMKTYYNTHFCKLVDVELSYENRSHIYEQLASQMLTCIKTNISTHFVKHLFKYINCLFKIPQSNEIKKEKDKEIRKEMYKKLNKEIRDLKTDLINNKIGISDEKYHKWIKENKTFLYPKKVNKSVAYDVKANPEKYIKFSFYINSQIEKLEYRPYQVLPQRNNIIPKHVLLNSSCCVQFLHNKDKNIFSYPKSEMILHCKKYQKHLWSQLLKLEKRKIFNQNGYVFYNQLLTDGFSCSLLFILEKYKDKKFGERLPEVNLEDNFKKLTDLTKKECNEYLKDGYKLASNDPGKNCLLSMIDDNENFYQYSCCRRRNDTYTNRANQITLKEKKKHKIIKEETKLSKFSSRTLDEKKYKKFIKKKHQVNKKVDKFYNNMLFRKIKFRIFTNTKQAEEQLLNEIENKFLTPEDIEAGKKLVILYGNWSRSSQMKNFMPTPNLGIKRLLAKRFILLDTDEFNTSKIYNKTHTELVNVRIRRGKHSKKIHEILTLKEDTEWRIYVNRDKNASINILNIGKCYLKNQTRPEAFTRKKQIVIQ